MPPSKILLSLALLICINLSCKDPEPPAAADCHVAAFTELGRTYLLEYSSEGLPVKVFRIVSGFKPILHYQLDYQDGKLTTIHSVNSEGVSFPETKFQYSGNRLHLIRRFDGFRKSVADTAFEIKERERIEFGYTASDKPATLIRWLPDAEGSFYKSHESSFEYNAAGNLAFERTHHASADYVVEYTYDKKPNGQKQLNDLFFAAADSPARSFSVNNLSSLIITHNNTNIRTQAFELVYDANGKLLSDGYRFEDVSWICK